jgi:hypothetical protein
MSYPARQPMATQRISHELPSASAMATQRISHDYTAHQP